jgi:hypothetical protein
VLPHVVQWKLPNATTFNRLNRPATLYLMGECASN